MEEVHGAAQAGVGLQDALNHQDEHDHSQISVQGEKESRLVQNWQASHQEGLGVGVAHRKTEQKDQVVESHVDWDTGIVVHDPEENLPRVGAAVAVGTI